MIRCFSLFEVEIMLLRILILLLLFIGLSCTPKKANKVIINKASDTISKNENSYKPINGGYIIKYTENTPKVIQYPFKSEKVLHAKIYRLPPIKSIVYNNLDSLLNYQCTKGESIDSNVLRITEYNYRLADIGKYSVFYMFDKGTDLNMDAMTSFIKSNCNMSYNYFGYIILYDKKTTTAIVLDVCHNYYIDADEFRNFYIDKDRVIHITDSSYTDGDNKNEVSEGNVIKRTVSILKNGEIKVKTEK